MIEQYGDLSEILHSMGWIADEEALIKMRETFESALPPANRYLPRTTPPIAFSYDKSLAVKSELVGNLFELYEFKLQILRAIRSDLDPKAEKFIEKSIIIERAFDFILMRQGNCSHRAAYAACQFFLILPPNVKIKYESAPSRDQFIVMIGNKDNGWLVYDPLTNPNLLFNLKFYQENVLKTFSLVQQEKRLPQLSLNLTEDVVQDFHRLVPILKEIVSEYYHSGKHKVASMAAANKLGEINYLERIMTPLFMTSDFRFFNTKAPQQAIQGAMDYIQAQIESPESTISHRM